MANWVPTQISLGELPTTGEEVQYPVAVNANQILVYAFISLHDLDNNPFQRGYYEIYTKGTDGTEYKYYMNVAFGGSSGDTTINSGNFWLPYGAGIQPGVFVRLIGVEMKHKKPQKSLAGKTFSAVMQEFSKQTPEGDAIYSFMFVTGYRPA